MNRIPITQTPGQATAMTVAMDPQPIIGPAPHSFSYILDSMAHRVRDAFINTLVVIGWIMGLAAISGALTRREVSVKLVKGSGKRAGQSEQPPGAAAVERYISSIFAKLGHNEHPATHRRVAAVLDDLGAAPR